MALEAELIFAATSRGVPWESVLDMELWQLASVFGLHRVETRADYDNRVIVETKKDYWAETHDARAEKLSDYSQRRRERAQARRQARKQSREEEVDV